jgi:hypothetical protein
MVPLPGLAAMRCWIYRSSRAYELHHFPWERFALYAVLYKHVLCIAEVRIESVVARDDVGLAFSKFERGRDESWSGR